MCDKALEIGGNILPTFSNGRNHTTRKMILQHAARKYVFCMPT